MTVNYRRAGADALRLLDNAGEHGLDRYEIMSGLGVPFALDVFNRIMDWARRYAAAVDQVIPRPTGYVDPATGTQRHLYRVTKLLGGVDGMAGARAGLLVSLADSLTRERTQVGNLAILRTSPALTPAIKARLTNAHSVALGQAAALENLIEMVELIP